jgi:hypothetical protein
MSTVASIFDVACSSSLKQSVYTTQKYVTDRIMVEGTTALKFCGLTLPSIDSTIAPFPDWVSFSIELLISSNLDKRSAFP